MKRYVALLRGINISGKNKIPMPELKKGFAELGFAEVVTYLNSGNVIFSADIGDKSLLTRKIELMIKDSFALDIAVLVILQDEIKEILGNAPAWWGDDNKEIYDNLIFLLPPLTYRELYDRIGAPKEEYEQAQNYGNVIFWSFVRQDYQKTNWWSKTAGAKVSDKLTIRTANTVRKIAVL